MPNESDGLEPFDFLENESSSTSVWQSFAKLSCVPDAWRLLVEGPEQGRSYPVLVLEFLEVEVTHHIDDRKIVEYYNLWVDLDGADMFCFRVFRLDRYGIMTPILTEDTFANVLAYLTGPAGRLQ